MQAMEAERTQVSVARERALVVHQEAQTEHKRAVMMVPPSSCRHTTICSGSICMQSGSVGTLCHAVAPLAGLEQLRRADGPLQVCSRYQKDASWLSEVRMVPMAVCIGCQRGVRCAGREGGRDQPNTDAAAIAGEGS